MLLTTSVDCTQLLVKARPQVESTMVQLVCMSEGLFVCVIASYCSYNHSNVDAEIFQCFRGGVGGGGKNAPRTTD